MSDASLYQVSNFCLYFVGANLGEAVLKTITASPSAGSATSATSLLYTTVTTAQATPTISLIAQPSISQSPVTLTTQAGQPKPVQITITPAAGQTTTQPIVITKPTQAPQATAECTDGHNCPGDEVAQPEVCTDGHNCPGDESQQLTEVCNGDEIPQFDGACDEPTQPTRVCNDCHNCPGDEIPQFDGAGDEPGQPTGDSTDGHNNPGDEPQQPTEVSTDGHNNPGDEPQQPTGVSTDGQNFPGDETAQPTGVCTDGHNCPGDEPAQPAGDDQQQASAITSLDPTGQSALDAATMNIPEQIPADLLQDSDAKPESVPMDTSIGEASARPPAELLQGESSMPVVPKDEPMDTAAADAVASLMDLNPTLAMPSSLPNPTNSAVDSLMALNQSGAGDSGI